jgi:hypothetical protein
MATLTIRASDSAAALEEAMRLLGPDALILSTRTHNGMVELVAGQSDDTAPAGPAATDGPRARAANATGVGGATGATTKDGPAAFGGHLRRALVRDRIAAPAVLPPHLPGRIVLAGPPGAGRSMLAARLAAEALRTPGAARPVLVAPRPDMLCPPGPVSGWARLLGLAPHRPVWAQGAPAAIAPPDPGETQIIDLSALPPLAPDALASLAALPDARLWLVLPTGLHPDYQDMLCAPLAGIADLVVLTRADLCAPTADDIALPARHGLPIGLLARGTGLLDALAPPPAATPVEFAASFPERQPKDHSDAAACLS